MNSAPGYEDRRARGRLLEPIVEQERKVATENVVNDVPVLEEVRRVHLALAKPLLDERVAVARLLARREHRPQPVAVPVRGDVAVAGVGREREHGRARRGARVHEVRVRRVGKRVPEHVVLAVVARELAAEPARREHLLHELGRRRHPLRRRVRDADEQLLEAGRQVEVQDVRVGLVDSEGVLRVAGHRHERAGRSL